MSVKSALERELKALPKDLREGALAAGALAVAESIDDRETKPADKAACMRALQAALDRLRELAPPEEAKDGVDEIAERRASRRAGGAAAKG